MMLHGREVGTVRNRRKGFTLIELLVVIAIIAILAAILFPAFVTAKERGRQIKCVANLKQLSAAFQMYADNNNGRAPIIAPWCTIASPNWCGTGPAGTFTGDTVVEKGSLWPYVRAKGIYICPTDVGREATGLTSEPDRAKRRAYPLSYSMTEEMWDTRGPTPVVVATATSGRSGKMLLFIHESRTRQTRSDGTQGPQGINDGLFLFFRNNPDLPDNVHWDGTTASYVDGHARWKSYRALLRDMNAGDWYANDSPYDD